MKKHWLKQIYHNHGDNHEKEVKTSIKKEKGFDLFHAKKPRLDIPDTSIKSIIENNDLLALPCSLSYNLKAELKTES
ncbi:unnamed protein product [Macrosiphum euphorbiae]|uniref:Uncharacterized protein n=1 Tax=Macrosiphum euphorbiae TaxID=13131 RepID=A0AAV0XKY3_9HEMI|nr:unnamed protein product [Macrosiphum euphorbiae]